MWYCSCGCENSENSGFCASCGRAREEAAQPRQTPEGPESGDPSRQDEVFQSSYRAMPDPAASGQPAARAKAPKKEPPAPKPKKPGKRKKRKSLWWAWLLAVLGLLTVAAVFCYFTVHLWTPATCTAPATCRICGETQGLPLNHSGSPATCTEPSVCSRCGEELAPPLGHEPSTPNCTEPSVCARCGETVAPALGHDWQEATYDRPETCSRCGRTQGRPKGWVGSIFGTLGEETLQLYGLGESHPYMPNSPLRQVCRLTLYFKVNSYEGDPFGTWGLFGKGPDGEWQLLGTFELTESAYQHYMCFPIRLDEQADIDALSMVAMTDGVYDLNYTFYFTDVQEYVD